MADEESVGEMDSLDARGTQTVTSHDHIKYRQKKAVGVRILSTTEESLLSHEDLNIKLCELYTDVDNESPDLVEIQEHLVSAAALFVSVDSAEVGVIDLDAVVAATVGADADDSDKNDIKVAFTTADDDHTGSLRYRQFANFVLIREGYITAPLLDPAEPTLTADGHLSIPDGSQIQCHKVLKDLAVNSPVLLRQQPRGEVRVSAVAEPTTTGYRVELMVEEAVHLVAPATLIDIAMVTSDGKHAMHYTAEFNASRNPRHEHVATRSVHKSSVEGASVTIRFYSSSFTEPTLGTVAFSLADVLSDDVTTAGWFHLLPEPAALTQHFRCSSIPGPSKCTPTLVRERLNSIQRRVSGVHVPAPRSLLDVTLSRTLGCGSYGKVILATDDRGNQFAIKGLSKAATIAHDDVQQVLVERQVLTQFRHPTIARLFSTFDTDNFLYFCLEPLLGGSLADIAVEGVELPPAAVAFFGGEILLGLWWLHDSGAIHRDMKLDNVLIDDAGHLRLADFGLAKILPWDTHTTRTFCGTPEYVAPEMLAGGAYGRSVDYWALGVLLYRLRIGAFPFPRGTDDDPEVIYRATSAKAPVMVPKGVDSACAHAIQGLLTRSVKNRLGCDMYRGGEDLRATPLFASIDWSELARRETPVPLRVEVEDAQGPPRDTSEGDVVGETMFMLDPTAEYDLGDGDNDPFDGFTWSQNHELLELLGLRLSLHPKKFLAGGASPKPERGTCKTTIIT